MTDQTPITALDARMFRDALGRYATGVALITTTTDQGPCGIMVNSFASVSLDPPLVLWSIDNASRRKTAFDSAKHTAIHILADDQRETCMGFTKDAFAFEGLTLDPSPSGTPLVAGALARFHCTPHAAYVAGDHTIYISRVSQVDTGPDVDPMVFYKGTFGSLP